MLFTELLVIKNLDFTGSDFVIQQVKMQVVLLKDAFLILNHVIRRNNDQVPRVYLRSLPLHLLANAELDLGL